MTAMFKLFKKDINFFRLSLLVIAIFFLCVPSSVFSQHHLTLDDCIKIALENNRYILYNAKLNLESARASFNNAKAEFGIKSDLNLSASRAYSKSELSQDSVSSIFSISRSKLYSGGLSLSKEFLTPAGGRTGLSLSWNLDRHDALGLEPYYDNTPRISFTLKQPIWKSARIVESSVIKTAKGNYQSRKMDHSLQRESLTISVINQFYSLLKTFRSLDRSKVENEFSKRTLAVAEARLAANEIAEIDVMSLRVEQMSSEDNLINAQNSLQNQKRDFLNTLGIYEDIELTLDSKIEIKPLPWQLAECIKTAREHRKELKQYDISLYNSKINVYSAESANKPYLNFDGYYNLSSQRNNLSNVMKEYPENSWYVGASMTIPLLDGGTRKNNLAQAKNSFLSLQRSKEKLEEEIDTEIERIYNNLQAIQRRLTILQKKLDIASEASKITELKFKLGLITSEDLTRAKERFTTAQQTIDDARIDYNIDRASLFKALGKLEEEYVH
ncbi:MAG: TolC family protein [Calditrichales bacterium]|nr:TolC family protein [Calditrichales bacterium]